MDASASQAANRLVSRLLGSQLYFSGVGSRQIKDILIDRQSGKVMYYVVDMEPDSLFDAQPRTIPADKVSIDKARVSTSIDFQAVDNLQKFNAAFLK
ncbi:MAG TPA: hypothetical protein VFY39_00625 [Gammaproteobacteria bacterium]|nr:hypothetical protein [Gammaproteobacteria bacterium]